MKALHLLSLCLILVGCSQARPYGDHEWSTWFNQQKCESRIQISVTPDEGNDSIVVSGSFHHQLGLDGGGIVFLLRNDSGIGSHFTEGLRKQTRYKGSVLNIASKTL